MSHIPYHGQEEAPRTKNGYELRADILKLSTDYVENLARLNKDYAEALTQHGQITRDQYIALLTPPSMADILGYAEQMYKFVNTKK